ncbi:MAG TPA: bi-domain-containing oxidoreductase [Pyrinomonadaceae bacterium]|jgi:predicted dehydrogenase|nr:bi-domain-containing oxidoreductase [Pyrinomonadaceae bacterium]
MKQVLRKGLKEIVVGEVPDPVALPHHVLVKPLYSLISSGTETADIHQDGIVKEVAENPSHLRKVWEVVKQQGPIRTATEVRAKFSEYAALGYSGAGVVVDKHPTVTDLEIGDRVAYGGEGTGHGETVVAGRNLVVKVPDAVPFEHACFTTLGSIAMNSVRIADISLGDTVAVIGLGLVGQLVAQLARAQGGRVIAVDIKADRIELARQLGADHALMGGSGTAQEVGALTGGRGVDCVIVAAASKSAAPVQQAIKFCRDRGRVVVVGAMPLDLPRDEMYIKELQLMMSRAYGPGSYDPVYEKKGQDYPYAYVRWTENRNMEEFLRQVALGRVELQPLVSHQFPLADAAEAYQTIMNPAANSLAVLLRYPADSAPEGAISFEPSRKVSVPRGAGASSGGGGLRVALSGAGNLARWVHLPNLKKISGVSLRAVHSASGARGKSYAERFGAAYSSSDYEEILRDPEVDVVLIVTRHEHHFAQALSALRAGKHVFIEKPMALTDDECRQLSHAVRETGKQLTVGFNRRFAPFYVEQKKLLARRTSPAVINCRMNSPGLVGSFWAADPTYGGAILGEGCHFVDLMYWLLDSEPVNVSAYCLPTGKQDPIGENNMVASFRFADGSVGNLTYCTVGSKTSGGEHVEVFAQGVGVSTEDFKRLTIKAGIKRGRKRLWGEKGYAAQLEAFIEGIRAGRQPDVTVRDGARATVACLRMLESARTLSPCTIDLADVLS